VWPDLHNHVIPGVDDGARDGAEAVAGIRALMEQGVERVVATPHIDGSLTVDPAALERRLAELDEGWARLKDAVGGDPAISLRRGAEVKLDVPAVDLADPRLRLDGGPTVLVEFPFLSVPPRSADALRAIRAAGYQPLLAHPERYQGVDVELQVVRSWIDAGAFLQVNAGSLLGRYGDAAADRARRIVGRGWSHCIASDFHCRGAPDVGAARALLEEWHHGEQAELLFEVNPARLLAGDAPLPVAPVQRRRSSPLRRLLDLLPWG